MQPHQLAAFYLWNPFGVLACASGSSSPMENAAIMAALYGAAAGDAAVAAFGVAVGAYLALNPLLLLVSAGGRPPARRGACQPTFGSCARARCQQEGAWLGRWASAGESMASSAGLPGPGACVLPCRFRWRSWWHAGRRMFVGPCHPSTPAATAARARAATKQLQKLLVPRPGQGRARRRSWRGAQLPCSSMRGA